MRILLLSAAALLLQFPAKADKFWLTSPESRAAAVEGSSPEVIEGVLLAEDQTGYTVRVVGGELFLPKASVHKVEKDGLTVEDVQKAEQEQRDRLAAADQERRMAQGAARRAEAVRVAEAAARPAGGQAVEAGSGPAFDPVIGRALPPGPASRELRLDLREAWALTRDARYLKLLRQSRRL